MSCVATFWECRLIFLSELRRQVGILQQDNQLGTVSVGEEELECCGHEVSRITSFSEDPNFEECLVFSTTPTRLSPSGRQIESTLATHILLNQMSVGLFSVTESNWHGAAYIHTPKILLFQKHAGGSQIACDLCTTFGLWKSLLSSAVVWESANWSRSKPY